jgi:hypothetical protein
MSARIKVTMVELPKSLNIHKIPEIKNKVEKMSKESLEILFYGVEDDAELLSEDDVLEFIEEQDLFKLDPDSKESLVKAYTSKKILIDAINDILTPILVGKLHSKEGRAILSKVGQSNYIISFLEEYSYVSKNDYVMLTALKISGILK